MTARARLALATMALLALVAYAYAPVKKGVFIWDDHALVEANPTVRTGSFAEIFRQPFWAADPMIDVRPAYYRPLSMLSFRIDHAFATDDAGAFHLTNLALHLLATLALVLAARRLGASTWQALVAAAAWALHPRITESVAWISGRTDVLASFLVLVGIAVWPWYGEQADEARRPAWRDSLRAVLAALAVVLGLLAKEVAIAGVLAIAAGTVLGTGALGATRRVVVAKRLAYLGAPLLGYFALRVAATSGITTKATPIGASARGATFLEALGRYVEMTLDAWHPATSIGLVGEIDRSRASLGAVILVISLVLSGRALLRWRAARRSAKATSDGAPAPVAPRTVATAVSAVLALVSIGLVLHVVPILLSASVTADRLLYLPLAGLALLLATNASRLSPGAQRVAGILALLIAATFAPVTRARAHDYTDELGFRVTAAEGSHPHNTSAKSGLANVLRAMGEPELACRLHESVRRSLDGPGRRGTLRHTRALENLGSCYEVVGDYERAASIYAELLSIRPDGARVHMEIGYLRLHLFDIDGAERAFTRALELDATLQPARRALDTLPSIRAARALLEADEERRADPLGWARLLTSVGRIPEANKAWLAIALDPEVPKQVGWEALAFIMKNGDLAAARSAVDAQAKRRDRIAAFVIREELAVREAKKKRVDALRHRIEALAGR